MFQKLVISFSLLAALVGCTSSGFHRGALRQQLSPEVAPIVTDEKIRETLALKPQLPKPFKIGVYFKTENDYWARYRDREFTDTDRQILMSLADELKATGEVSDLYLISDSSVGSSDLKALRLAAARHGADALLVVSAKDQIDSYSNGWAWTYIALVPALFVPGTVEDSLYLVRAAMWDVRNEYLYLTADAESVKSKTTPAAFTRTRELQAEARADALVQLRGELSSQLKSIVSSPALQEKRATDRPGKLTKSKPF